MLGSGTELAGDIRSSNAEKFLAAGAGAGVGSDVEGISLKICMGSGRDCHFEAGARHASKSLAPPAAAPPNASKSLVHCGVSRNASHRPTALVLLGVLVLLAEKMPNGSTSPKECGSPAEASPLDAGETIIVARTAVADAATAGGELARAPPIARVEADGTGPVAADSTEKHKCGSKKNNHHENSHPVLTRIVCVQEIFNLLRPG
jgi:hypothetical protein